VNDLSHAHGNVPSPLGLRTVLPGCQQFAQDSQDVMDVLSSTEIGRETCKWRNGDSNETLHMLFTTDCLSGARILGLALM
jgi:hypothetical protein